MKIWKMGIIFLLTFFEFATGRRRLCGPDLANAMMLACKGRGYNVAFRGEKRFKRGIVDECCRRGCSWSTLEMYCSASPSNIQIRKRSEFPNKLKSDSLETESYNRFSFASYRPHTDMLKVSYGSIKPDSNSRTFSKTGKDNRHSELSGSRSIVNKVKRNDIIGNAPSNQPKRLTFSLDWEMSKLKLNKQKNERDDLSPRSSIPVRYRHRKSGKKIIKENSNSQIGTVPPYFLGRTLVMPNSSKHV
uniref:Insulin-like peptide 1 n=1 Tax=Pyrrhocoris apterus TaxID=37000 RepID=A0A6G7NUG2_PYRAP|nr:insulin-like peptide 1 [Pyrrhocoris apterus]